jgi:hypothetical protein
VLEEFLRDNPALSSAFELFNSPAAPSVPLVSTSIQMDTDLSNITNMQQLSPSEAAEQAALAKRAQVPKACSNCRRMHAGCDLGRPCRRCIQNALESSCVDVPRKKRSSRKTPKEDTSPDIKMEDPSRVWEDTYNEIFGQNTPDNRIQPYTPPSNFTNQSFDPYVFQPESLLLADMGLPRTPPLHSAPTQMAIPRTPSSSNLTGPDWNFLVQQISELRDSNKNLENRLSGVTHELSDMKVKPKPSTVSLVTGWHTFQPQPDLAISVWKATTPDEEGSPRNVLVECNQKFVDMLGYGVDTLKNNFTCNRLVRKQDICPENRDKNGREWPKRTQIITAFGFRDVYITISPVHDQSNVVKYYIVHILDSISS